MRATLFSLTLIATAGVARAESEVPEERIDRLTFDQAMAKALAGPKVQMAIEDKRIAQARADEADSASYPRAKASAFGTASPKIRCLDPVTCTATDPQNFAFRYSGVWGGAQLDVVQPLFTFGKNDKVKKAARAGVAAYTALVDEAAGDVAVDLAKAFYGAKLSHELVQMLDDGIEKIEKAIDNMNKQTGSSAPSVQDRQRVAVLLAEVRTQRADAAAAETQALAGLRALVGMEYAGPDAKHIEPVELAIPARVDGKQRPQAVAARAGADAADEIVRAGRSAYFPEISLVGTALIAGATGAEDPPSAYANDPYNRSGVNVFVNLQWNIDPFRGAALKDRIDADARKAHSLAQLAAAGANYDAKTALAELTAAKAKVDAAAEGKAAGRTWVASVLQGEAIGVVEAKDLADAFIASFQMQARWLQAVYQLNVAVVKLRRATGECRPNRPCS